MSKLQEVLAGLPAEVRRASTPAAAAQLMAALARLEGEPLPEADCAAPRSLEALRLEDPAAMSGCWNPGCEAALVMAGRWRALGSVRGPLAVFYTCMHMRVDLQAC